MASGRPPTAKNKARAGNGPRRVPSRSGVQATRVSVEAKNMAWLTAERT